MSNPLLENAVHGAYKCNDCNKYSCVTMIPAIIAGVVEELPMNVFDGISCSVCHKQNCTIVFTTKDAAEAAAYLATIDALENSND